MLGAIRSVTTSADVRLAHINNVYNTVFWALVLQGGQTTTEAHATLRVSSITLFLRSCPHIELDA